MLRKVTKHKISRTVLEKPTKGGESPVSENFVSLASILSTTEHV
ncbi:hypothetical protein LEP1GSC193_2779 [Leptospira alstonii serovar Pingchang str. 80-412]|uniref:Uncharacterized protein n=2 Tax=Leptospira alstonii TaxID=28452 RepID=M6CQW3_9LEPT|nr:hypothetical protein LEP1GSC194_1012 [Leptospira alstonii serovar Sichuan str. 79601]EMJ91461.1 hypothetical protein LEP1GSC194_0219 [Leptospira alstonii serovar Sichuan str. 79601]EMJ95108.1 hypothetical protein LEP1GSC194_3231 [Leptospira alstonii serovar Sichuan str. 79601]EMJ95254.1 hypothetical protein LEP1GSC194_0988 [Leptospira alstonii serovar Sichuan str. 79601]EQA79236.1 hypothetical protein LEP1GSC193_2779 [Leptospira alstonii serovar Pingchang str. 80-412]